MSESTDHAKRGDFRIRGGHSVFESGLIRSTATAEVFDGTEWIELKRVQAIKLTCDANESQLWSAEIRLFAPKVMGVHVPGHRVAAEWRQIANTGTTAQPETSGLSGAVIRKGIAWIKAKLGMIN